MIDFELETMNKLHNLSNPYQGKDKKVLTVCSAGLLRSPSTAVVLNREFGFNTRSCGLDENYALVPFSHALWAWANEVVVMEAWMKQQIETIIVAMDMEINKPILCLNIRDSYAYMDERLQELIVRNYDMDGELTALQRQINKELDIKD